MAIVVNGKKVAGVGLPGKDGAPGADGKDGAPGKSAYQAAKEKGYTGTEEEFNTALAGMQSAPFLPLAGGTMAGAITLSGPRRMKATPPISSTWTSTRGRGLFWGAMWGQENQAKATLIK